MLVDALLVIILLCGIPACCSGQPGKANQGNIFMQLKWTMSEFEAAM